MILARVCSEFQIMIDNEIIINICRVSTRYIVKMVEKEHMSRYLLIYRWIVQTLTHLIEVNEYEQ